MPAVARSRRPLPKPAPEADPRFRKVMEHLKQNAAKTKHHAPAAKKAQEASGAAKGPPNERLATGKAKQVDKIKEAPAKKPDENSFLAVLRAEIQKAMPKTLGETEDFMKGGSKEQLKGSLQSNVSQQKSEAEGATKTASKEPPKETGQAKEVKAIPPEGVPAPPPVNGPEGMPAPKTDAEISLQDSKQDVDAQMKEADITDKQLQKANDPRFSAVLTAKDAVGKQADAAPAQYRAGEKVVIAGAASAATAQARKGASAMVAVRGGSNSAVLSKQAIAKQKEEQERKKVTDHIEEIYNKTKAKVEQKLSSLETEVGSMFDAGVEKAVTGMTDYVNARLDAYKDERYSGITGGLKWAKDKLFGLPDEVKVFYDAGRKLFTQLMDALVVKVAALVESRLKEAKDEVAKGQAEIKSYVDGLAPNLKSVGQSAAKDMEGRFQQLTQSIDDKKNELAQQLAQKYKEAFDKANAELKKIEDANKGLVTAFVEKLGEIIKILREFKDKLMALLKKAADVIGQIVADPIGFLGNLIAAIKKGIGQFVDNIWTHLKKGFMTWLFGALAEAGIEIPSDLSLPSILKLVLGVLGITYERMRAKAVKLVGERAVSIIEKLVQYIKALIEGGPAKLWEMVKEDLSNLKDMVIGALQDWLITTIVKKATIKLISMFNPAGAIIQAILLIYDTVTFLIENASKIMAFVEAVIDSVAAIAAGAIGGAANWIEQALGRMVPLLIGFLAQLLGLGGVSKKIKEFITKVQDFVDKAIDKAIAKVVAIVKKLFGSGKGDKDKPPEGDDALGETITISAAGETHKLWIARESGEPEVMLASSAAALTAFLGSKDVQDAAAAKPPLKAKVDTALKLTTSTRTDAQKVLKAQSAQQAAAASGQKGNIKTKEQQIAALLIEIIKEVHGEGAIFQVLGKPVDPIAQAPDGYVFKNVSSVGYGPKKEIERGSGRGAGRGSYPEVYVDAAGSIQQGVGLRRADHLLVDAYKAALASLPKQDGDEEPDLVGDPDSLISDLSQRVQAKRHPLAEGIRAQMQRIIEVIKSGAILTGVEVPIGKRRSVDYSLNEAGQNVLVEYKHWTGNLSPKRRIQLTSRLRNQLREYVIRGQNAGYAKVRVEFKAFSKLDAASQASFRSVFTAMEALATQRSGMKTKRAIVFEYTI